MNQTGAPSSTDSPSPIARRDFLRTAALGAGAAALATAGLSTKGWSAVKRVKIERIDTYPVRYPTVGRFKFFEGPEGSPQGRPAVLIRIQADDGTVGWGESVPIPKWSDETLEGADILIRRYLAPELLGRDPFDIEGAHAVMNRAIAPGFSTGAPITKAGIDLALHDLVGKLTGQSLAQMWGRPRGGPIRISWTLNPKTLEETEGLIAQGLKRGYTTFNIKVAPDPKVDLELARIVKRLAPDGFLWADANGGYDLPTALEVAPRLADIGVSVLESPIRPNRISGYRALKKQGALPILMDEGVISPEDLIEFIKLDMMDGVAMKPARCGGLLPQRRQIEIIEDAGLLWLGSGLTDPDVSLAASLALYGAYGLKTPAALNGPQFLAASVLKRPLEVTNGHLAVPEGAGLAVEIDEKKVKNLVAESGTSAEPKRR
jgi:L-alanine-DL-glutamate epimerase-like enolase superfamily enzyme